MQIFKGRTLDELIADFKSQISAREEKINARISTLDIEAQQIREDVEAETRNLIEAELDDDVAAQEKARKLIKKHNQRLSEVQDLAAAYRQELQSKVYTSKDIQKIREAAVKEHEVRLQTLKALDDERKSLEQQIRQLEYRLEQVSTERSKMLNFGGVGKKLMAIKDFIGDIRINMIPASEKGDIARFLENWTVGSEEGMEAAIYTYKLKEEAAKRDAQPKVMKPQAYEETFGKITGNLGPQPVYRGFRLESLD